MSLSDYTGLDDAQELAQRMREHEADDLDHALDCESEDSRAHEARAQFWRWYATGVLVAAASTVVIFWPQIAALIGVAR